MAGNVTVPFLAFATDGKDQETLKRFAEAHGWKECVHAGDIRTAAQFLKDNAPPLLLVVEITSAAEAKVQLDALSEVCSPDTKVIVIGTINEYSFYCWLMEIGISSYLLRPLTDQVLEGAHGKSVEPTAAAAAAAKAPGTVVAVIGTRGGVGATTLSINLAGILAETTKKKTALVDVDPQEGSVALAMDLEPSKGFREALEKPDRIDSLFLERVMHKHGSHLSILSAEETLQDKLTIHESAADALLKELKTQFPLIVIDMPRHISAFNQKCMAQADHIVLVTEMTLLGLRDTLRLSDMMRDMRLKTPIIVANRVGLSAKNAVSKEDFEKGVNAKLAYTLSFTPDVFMQIGHDIPAVKLKNNATTKPLYQLAQQLVPGAKVKEEKGKTEKGFSLFKKKG